ncbi:hypothetical protein [Pantoea septica]|uniref:hypothetical protein n=1 Tax=Pantoea septica TaxID=472695 RepID=UPI0028987331|nr:hypothetical protein [Pantoea septica]
MIANSSAPHIQKLYESRGFEVLYFTSRRAISRYAATRSMCRTSSRSSNDHLPPAGGLIWNLSHARINHRVQTRRFQLSKHQAGKLRSGYSSGYPALPANQFQRACKGHFHCEGDPVWDEVLSGLLIPSSKKRITFAYASGCRPQVRIAVLSVWFLLCTPMGRAFIFSPDIAMPGIVREIIQLMTLHNPALGYALEFDALSVLLKAGPEHRIEWMHPDTLTNAKIEQMKGCYLDQAHQCVNELLGSLRETISPEGGFDSPCSGGV